MSLSYKDLVFESNKTHDYTSKTEKIDIYQELEDNLFYYRMELYDLPENINLRCNNVKMFGVKQLNSKFVYFHLSREFDIFFSVKSITNSEYIIKQELCYTDGLKKITNVEFNTDICVPLYIHKCIKVEYDDVEHIPDKVEMIYSTGLLKHEYKNNIININFPY